MTFRKLYHKMVQRYNGIPVMVVVYKPWRSGKNVYITTIEPFKNDALLRQRFAEIAEHIREEYQEKMDEIIREGEDES